MIRYSTFLLLALLTAHAGEVQVGVLGLFHPEDVAISAEAGHPLECGSEQDRRAAVHRWKLKLVRSRVSIDAEGRISLADSLHCDDGHGGYTGLRISIPGKISRRYLGRLEIKPESGELLMIISMELETAVASVVAAESSPDTPLEALKAQAVAARSFLVAGGKLVNAKLEGGVRHRDFDFCDNTHCQFLRAPPDAQSMAAQAARATRALVLAYHDQTLTALYSASCGGQTHSLEDLGLPVRDYPYFSVPCAYCQRHPRKWATRMSRTDAEELRSTESSRLRLARRLGWKAVPSNSYSLHQGLDSVLVEGTGVGHGIGLCQRGGADMARNGSSFIQILEHYYPNTVLKVSVR